MTDLDLEDLPGRLARIQQLAAHINTTTALLPLLPELIDTMTVASLKRGNPRRPGPAR